MFIIVYAFRYNNNNRNIIKLLVMYKIMLITVIVFFLTKIGFISVRIMRNLNLCFVGNAKLFIQLSFIHSFPHSFSWTEFVLLMGRHPRLSTFITMFGNVSWNFARSVGLARPLLKNHLIKKSLSFTYFVIRKLFSQFFLQSKCKSRYLEY